MPIVAMGRTESQILCRPALSSASHATHSRQSFDEKYNDSVPIELELNLKGLWTGAPPPPLTRYTFPIFSRSNVVIETGGGFSKRPPVKKNKDGHKGACGI